MQLNRDARAILSMLLAEEFPVGDKWPVEHRQAATAILWRDLVGKLPAVSHLLRFRRLGEAHDNLSGSSVEALLNSNEIPRTAPRVGDDVSQPNVDVLLICPLPKEALAALIAFTEFDDDVLTRKEELNLDGRKIYLFELPRRNRRPLKVGLAVYAQARNVPAAIATLIFLLELAPDAAILCGIGGGVKDKVKLGDVVFSRSVIDVAGGREEPTGLGPRPEPLPLFLPISRQLEYLAPHIVPGQWRALVLSAVEKLTLLGSVKMPRKNEVSTAPFEVKDGIIVAGERLVADGSLPAHLASDNRIRACDMEGSGFAQSCIERKVHWAVFRGISDYGDPDKTDVWQGIAAFAAVRAAIIFLATEFRLREEMQTTSF